MKSEIAKRLALETGLRRGIQWLYPPASVWAPLEDDVVRNAWNRVFLDTSTGDAANAVDLHVNVPFSLREPRYCDYIHAVVPDVSERGHYISLLRKEFDSLCLPNARFRRLFFTGGAASILTPVQVDELYSDFLAKLDFSEAGATMEIGHCPATFETLRALAHRGVRRTVIDVQSMRAALSSRLAWRRTRRDVGRLADLVRRAGIQRIRFNVTAGFPGQTVAEFSKDLKFLLSLEPDSILLQPFSPAPLSALDPGPTTHTSISASLSPREIVARSQMISIGYRMIAQASLPPSPSEDWCGSYGSQLCLGFGSLSRARTRLIYRRARTYSEYVRCVEAGTGGHLGYAMDARREMRSYAISQIECPGYVRADDFRRLFGTDFVEEFTAECAGFAPGKTRDLDLSRLSPLHRAVLSKRFYEDDIAAAALSRARHSRDIDSILLQLYSLK